jgi:eukaryotic-like serine/threonine-protein kinase
MRGMLHAERPAAHSRLELGPGLGYRRTKMADDVFGIVGTTQAGAYRVEAVVAEGGFAVVYRAYHQAFRAKVALKCLKVPDTLGSEHHEEFLERFREEGELLFRLSSSTPAVVRPLHVGILERTQRFVPFIALEWLDGQTLEDMVAQRVRQGQPPISLKVALRMLTPVARALDRAHHFPGPDGNELCILHRDLKPDNVFIADLHGEQMAKVLDFGIGKVKSVATQMVGHQSAQGDGIVAFTPNFGSPEQWLPKRFGQTGPWTDVWGLALTLLEAITGRAPFEGDQAALLGSAIDPGRRPTPRSEGLEVPDAVERVFQKAVAVDPRDRYGDMGVFWTDLHRAAGYVEGQVTLPPPALNAPAELVVSLAPDQKAKTRAYLPGELEVASSRVPDLTPAPQVPDLDLAPPPPRPRSASNPAPEPARPAPQRITVARGDQAPAGLPASMLGGGLLDDESDYAPLRASSSSQRSIPLADGLDGVGLTPRSVPVRVPVARASSFEPSGPTARELRAKLSGPVRIVVVGMLVMVADFAYTYFTGEQFALGPLRPLYIAGPLVVAGIAMAFMRFFSEAR